MTDKIEELIERLHGPVQWGYMCLADGGFIADDAPVEAAAALRTQRKGVVEECARIMDERAAMYRAKATKRDINAPDTLTLHECLVSNAEACEWGATAIRNLKSDESLDAEIERLTAARDARVALRDDLRNLKSQDEPR